MYSGDCPKCQDHTLEGSDGSKIHRFCISCDWLEMRPLEDDDG